MGNLEKNEKMLGVMIDCSRNAVMRVEEIKKYADIIRKMGYNTLMLYTEDTYEVDNQPYFGHLRGRYTKAELKELDGYCQSIGIELIPCIQTLAHLGTMFKWNKEYACVNDCDDILLTGDEKTYKLIEDMVSSLSQCYSTKKVHIGMDEAFRVGTGKYKNLHGEKDKFDIINEHLKRVCEILNKYGFTEPIVWCDMFLKLAMDADNRYDCANKDRISEKPMLPENVSVMYWDYYNIDYNHYVEQIEMNKLFKRKLYFAGGLWTFKGMVSDNGYSIETTKAAVRACNDCGIDGILMTSWGDGGGECSKFSVLPALMYAAEASKGNFDMESIKAKFKEIVGADFDSFLLWDKLDAPSKKDGSREKFNPEANDCYNEPVSKLFLYSDMFMGMYDFIAHPDYCEYYKKLSEEIKNAPSKGGYELLFDYHSKLADILSIKASLGVKTREAYKQKNIDALKEFINDCDALNEKLKEFYEIFKKIWYKESKPQGFEIQALRIGGLMQRISDCKERLQAYVNGDIAELEELNESVLAAGFGGGSWFRTVSANVIP